MDEHLIRLVWRGIADANPWWQDGEVPDRWAAPFRRHAFDAIYGALTSSEAGRGVVLLGPRRVGKTVILHQVAEQLLADGVSPSSVCSLALDDVALRDRDLGELLDLVEARMPWDGSPRYLLLDEVQHSPAWAGWLKRLADRRDPYIFFATGSSATALSHGGQDAGLGRWREMVLYPWSFREHVQLRHRGLGAARGIDVLLASPPDGDGWWLHLDPRDARALDYAFVDYLLRGGFPEAALAEDLREARRRLRQDILDRALGRDILDAAAADPRTLERMFLRICMHPGGLWNASEVAADLGISRPSVSRYLDLLERAFLVFRLPNLASPIKGQPKVYLVAPSLRQALLGMDEVALEAPEEWARMAENAVVATLMGTRVGATHIGFWRRGRHECDGVVIEEPARSEFIEVKRSGRKVRRGISEARSSLRSEGVGWILTQTRTERAATDGIATNTVAAWLYQQDAASGGTLRMRL